MRRTKLFLATLALAIAGGGALSAQPTEPAPPAVTASGEKAARLTSADMEAAAKKHLGEMEAMLVRVLELQKSARKSKDVIKLNCVNEKLLAVKQLLNIAESAQTDLTEARAAGDSAGELHQYGQVKLAHERCTVERDEAEGCIGEEVVFVGPTQVDVSGPAITDDPTAGLDDPFGEQAINFERPAYSTPYGQEL